MDVPEKRLALHASIDRSAQESCKERRGQGQKEVPSHVGHPQIGKPV